MHKWGNKGEVRVALEWADEKSQCPLLSAQVLVPLGHNQLLTKRYCSQEEDGTESYETVRRQKITKDKKRKENQSIFL